MNYIDIAIAVPIIWGIYKGFTKGLIIELSSIIGLVAGVYIGMHYSYITEQYLNQYLDVSESLMPITSFAITFVLVVLGTFILGKTLEKIVNLVALKFINKLAGSLFGAIKFTFIVSLLLVLVESIDSHIPMLPKEMKENSLLYNGIGNLAPSVIPKLKELDLLEEATKKADEVVVNL